MFTWFLNLFTSSQPIDSDNIIQIKQTTQSIENIRKLQQTYDEYHGYFIYALWF